MKQENVMEQERGRPCGPSNVKVPDPRAPNGSKSVYTPIVGISCVPGAPGRYSQPTVQCGSFLDWPGFGSLV